MPRPKPQLELRLRYRDGLRAIRADTLRQLVWDFLALDPDDIDGTKDAYLDRATVTVKRGAGEAVEVSDGYMTAAQIMETGQALTGGKFADLIVARIEGTMALSGPITFKQRGARSALANSLNAGASLLYDAARDELSEQFQRNPDVIGYRRVISPTACSRCRVLGERVYRVDTAFFKRHPHCTCTAEAVWLGEKTLRDFNRIGHLRRYDTLDTWDRWEALRKTANYHQVPLGVTLQEALGNPAALEREYVRLSRRDARPKATDLPKVSAMSRAELSKRLSRTA